MINIHLNKNCLLGKGWHFRRPSRYQCLHWSTTHCVSVSCKSDACKSSHCWKDHISMFNLLSSCKTWIDWVGLNIKFTWHFCMYSKFQIVYVPEGSGQGEATILVFYHGVQDYRGAPEIWIQPSGASYWSLELPWPFTQHLFALWALCWGYPRGRWILFLVGRTDLRVRRIKHRLP